MCRSNVDASAQDALAELLGSIRDALAAEHGVEPGECAIGPVDFGWDEPCGENCATYGCPWDCAPGTEHR